MWGRSTCLWDKILEQVRIMLAGLDAGQAICILLNAQVKASVIAEYQVSELEVGVKVDDNRVT
jgi:hypothetical protein